MLHSIKMDTWLNINSGYQMTKSITILSGTLMKNSAFIFSIKKSNIFHLTTNLYPHASKSRKIAMYAHTTQTAT